MAAHARLTAAATLVRDGVVVVDVGTDHAYLPLLLVQQGKCPRAIGCDLRPGPLENARRHVEQAGLTDVIDLRLCDGLSAVSPEEVDDVCLCGLGGEVIAAVLAAAPWTKDPEKRLILQPMSAEDDLRRFLAQEGYAVEREVLVRDAGRLYLLLAARFTGERESHTGDYWIAGNVSVAQPFGEEYLTRRLTRLEKGIRSLARARDPARRAVLPEWEETARRLRARIKEGSDAF